MNLQETIPLEEFDEWAQEEYQKQDEATQEVIGQVEPLIQDLFGSLFDGVPSDHITIVTDPNYVPPARGHALLQEISSLESSVRSWMDELREEITELDPELDSTKWFEGFMDM